MKVCRLLATFLIAEFLSGLFCSIAIAQIGVGVGTGTINIGEALEPGGIYKLPDLPVVNTGEMTGDYRVQAEGMKGPVALSKDSIAGWFRFSPSDFSLSSGQSQLVEVTLTLPLSVPDGTYLIYLEASPVVNPQSGFGIGPIAATKLYFTTRSGSVLGAVRNRVVTWILYRSEIYLVLAFLCFIEAVVILCRHFRLRIERRGEGDRCGQKPSRYSFGG